MPDARAKRRRRRRQEQLEAADLEMVSGFAVETHMVAGASIGSVAALVLAYMLWPENSYIFTPQVMGMTLGGGALGAFIMGCRKIPQQPGGWSPCRWPTRAAKGQVAGDRRRGAVLVVALAVAAVLFADRSMQIVAGLAAISICPLTGYAVWPVAILIVDLNRHPDPTKNR